MTGVTKTEVTNKVKEIGNSISSSVQDQANTAKGKLSSAIETKVGVKSGEITGGVKSLSSSADKLTGKLEGKIAGELDKEFEGLTNKLNDKLSVPDIEFGSGNDVEYVEIDIVVNNETKTIKRPTSKSITKVTKSVEDAMGAAKDFTANVTAAASPKGIKAAVEKLEGEVGALSADELATLRAEAEDIKTAYAANVSTKASQVAGGLYQASSITGEIDGAAGGILSAINKAADLVKDGLKVAEDKLEGALKELGDKVTDELNITDDINTLKDAKNKVQEKADNLKGSIESKVSSSGTGLIQGLTKDLDQEANKAVKKLAPDLTDEEVDEVITLTQGTKAEQAEAVSKVKKKSSETAENISNSLSGLDTTIAGTVVVENEQSAFNDPHSLDDGTDGWNNGQGDVTFTYVSSVEELEAEIKKITREVTEVIVHWTDTYSNKNIGSEEINEIHKDLGLDGIAYHYIIRRDGSLQRGRPVGTVGQHADANGHDEYSIGIAFVGGINAASGTENVIDYRGVESLTRGQLTTFELFCQAFYNIFPGGQILGHNDIDVNEIDPGFDVRDYVLDLFGKRSLFDDPSSRGPFSPSELISQRLP